MDEHSARNNREATTIPQAIKEAVLAYDRGDWAEADRCCRQVLRASADSCDALHLLGIIAAQIGRTEEAADLLERAIAANPGNAAAHTNYANVLRTLNRPEDALNSFTHALSIDPNAAEAHYNRAITLHELKRFEEALDSYAHAVKINASFAEAYYARGNTLALLKRFEEALDSYEHGLRIRPDFANAYNNRGVSLHELKRFEEALDSYDRALKMTPSHAEAYFNRGISLHELRRFDQALDSYDRALKINPSYAEAYFNRGNTLQNTFRLEEALQSYEQALQLQPDLAEAFHGRGVSLADLGRHEEALVSFERALHLNAGRAWLAGDRLRTKLQLCDWTNLDVHIAQLQADVRRGKDSVMPFVLLAFCDSPALQRQAAQLCIAKEYPARTPMPVAAAPGRRSKIRLGYYSADYGDHPVAHLAVGLFEEHDRTRFEVVAFSWGPPRTDEMSNRLKAAFDQFVDVRGRSDREVAELSRDLGIDIAVDLMGFTGNSRTGIFAERAAPIQVNYLGYPGTMAAPYIDYLIADATVVPQSSRAYYAERIVYLPDSFQPNDRNRPIAEREFSREELGLPPAAFVFCCFNNTYKITPAMFSCWMRILGELDGSVLWLASANEALRANLCREAAARGVSPERLIFAEPLPRVEDHLARHRAADLFLDTHPFNAHTTASNALWAGLPILTCLGDSLAARVGASLLNAIGLPELIAVTLEHYEALAIEFGNNRHRLAELKQRLSKNRIEMPLFETKLFTRHIEEAYSQMYERQRADLRPEDIYVSR